MNYHNFSEEDSNYHSEHNPNYEISLRHDSRQWGSDFLANPNNMDFEINNNSQLRDILSSPKSKKILNLSLQMGLNSQLVLHLLRNSDMTASEEQIMNNILDQYNKYLSQREAEGQGNILKKSEKLLKKVSSELRRSSIPLRASRNSHLQSNIEIIKGTECPICLEEILKDANYVRLICGHFTCKNCFDEYLRTKITNSQVNNIKCPYEGCQFTLHESEVVYFLKSRPDLLKKFYKFKNTQEIAANPNMKWCIRPDCEKIVKVNLNAESSYVRCECGQEFCFKCNNAWHPGQACEDYIEGVYKNYIQRAEVKFCPNCHALIEKNDGCNHMTCLQCDYQFCWICERKYTNNHYSPLNINGCPGLQFANITKKTSPWTRRWIWIKSFFLLFISIFLILTLGPILAAIIAIILPVQYFFCKRPVHCRNCCDCLLYSLKFIGLLILGIITSPITFVALILLFFSNLLRRDIF